MGVYNLDSPSHISSDFDIFSQITIHFSFEQNDLQPKCF